LLFKVAAQHFAIRPFEFWNVCRTTPPPDSDVICTTAGFTLETSGAKLLCEGAAGTVIAPVAVRAGVETHSAADAASAVEGKAARSSVVRKEK